MAVESCGLVTLGVSRKSRVDGALLKMPWAEGVLVGCAWDGVNGADTRRFPRVASIRGRVEVELRGVSRSWEGPTGDWRL
eukprot:CAMPEP_0175840786 /NCGR_PEP_ID=MMETSP0107_2-20121207/19562_1 /TAXON_ID=195067 ORGANISM="Goniomonas pacifica, Strain CCMP1869" /NCGR_SAMPLE_ID=MMETSP0107_2 /ASSEMBLY_ACC=CAM_ASM_000203 /LENGTH=79 /DNA_ID=CAMNT_0017154671 /DNA_START=235 /DNA_END=474 /DNA_ORIENTATION=-